MRRHVAKVLGPDCQLVGEAGDGQALLDLVARTDPDLVVMDISMPGVNGIVATRRLARSARARVILLTVHDSVDYARAGLASGSAGYVVKSRMAVDLRRAVEVAERGGTFVSPTDALAALAAEVSRPAGHGHRPADSVTEPAERPPERPPTRPEKR